jgi:hypothetical protein
MTFAGLWFEEEKARERSSIMKRWLNIAASLICMSLFTQGCGRHAVNEPACGFVQNVYGERVSWKSTAPVELYVHESFPTSMYPALENAMKDWEIALGRPVFHIAAYGVQKPAQPAQDGMSVIYWLSAWESNKASEQARTSVYWNGDRIGEADIRLNAKDYRFYLDFPHSYGDVHLESLLVHELGHVLGLKHRDDGGSVMATYLASQTVRNNIAPVDLSDISCEYQ